MPRTVVGLFDDLSTARRAEQALQQAGLIGEHLLLASSPLAQALAGEGVPVTERQAGVQMLQADAADRLEQFGLPREKAEHYAETVRRGGAALVLRDLDDPAAERAAHLLLDHRPVDPERRLSAYHEAGHPGYTPVANPFAADQASERNRYADEHHGQVDVIYVM